MNTQTQAEALRWAQFYEKFNDGASVATAAELRRLQAENEQLRAEVDQRDGMLAKCRDAFGLPERGTPADDHFCMAMTDPGYVADYVAIRAKELEAQAQPAREPLTDERIAEIASTPCAVVGSYVHTFARAIERAHGITKEKP